MERRFVLLFLFKSREISRSAEVKWNRASSPPAN